ncbi:cytochrome c [Aurantiacibacter sp. MUD11]|uniref:c-type cytochrome n=1 Tax=Aurantiacibacter sp. MUD11 TaxID=3003265 RepID=UPI0022AA7891|nr:cytochrome c [Aurantiacibacter sp. MUD11]WAT17610.1 cytochrome c [Aurantiacibacter sp. MUD11]
MRFVLASAATLALCVGAATAQQATRTGPAAPELEQGKAVYAHWCAPCHADHPGLAGTASLAIKYADSDIPAALEDRTDLSAPLVAYFVRNGVAWMPPFRPTEISDAELAALSAYLTAPLEDRGAHTPLLADEMATLETDP